MTVQTIMNDNNHNETSLLLDSSTTATTSGDLIHRNNHPERDFSLNDFIKHTYASMNEKDREDLLRQGSNHHISMDDNITVSTNSSEHSREGGDAENGSRLFCSMRRIALDLSLYLNLIITFTKLVAYVRTMSLSVLAALLDSVLDVVSQAVLNYTETHSSMQRSSAFYPAGASRLEPIGVLTCAALMGMASFEVLKESFQTLVYKDSTLEDLSLSDEWFSFWSMIIIVGVKLGLLWVCQKASHRRQGYGSSKAALQLADPTLEALAQDHWNDALSNGVAAFALLVALNSSDLWWVDPVGAILISIYIIYSWYHTGREQIEQLTGKSAPTEFIDELLELAEHFDGRLMVDTCRAYHFGPKFLVELEVVMPQHTLLKESHDLGMELQYEIEAREEVERCFVHIDYETRPYDEHVVSKVPELREHLVRRRQLKSHNSV
jgi:cation diffusion facilitator family transporter